MGPLGVNSPLELVRRVLTLCVLGGSQKQEERRTPVKLNPTRKPGVTLYFVARSIAYLAGGPGFEPRLTESES
jgi:hypothetical protein